MMHVIAKMTSHTLKYFLRCGFGIDVQMHAVHPDVIPHQPYCETPKLLETWIWAKRTEAIGLKTIPDDYFRAGHLQFGR